MKRFFILFTVMGLLAFLFSSCAANSLSAEEMLLSIMVEAGELPAGQIYLKSAQEGSGGYFSLELCEAMYGEGAYEIFSLIEDFAIYLSSAQAPYEIAVFKCFSSTDAEKLGALCLERVELLRVLLAKTEWRDLVDGAVVTVKGRTTVMIISN